MGALADLGTFNRRNIVHFIHKVTCSTSGTIASQDAPSVSGVVATKTAANTGRYTMQLPKKYRKFHGGHASLIGPDDATWGAKAKGSFSFFRDNDVDGGAADGTVELQFVQFTDATNTVDAELPDSAIFIAHLWVEE